MRRNGQRLITVFVILAVATCFAWAGAQQEATGVDEIPKIELMEPGWVNQPTDDNDPFKAFLDETFGVDITLNNTSEFYNEVLTRFATDDPPDIVAFDAGANGEGYLRQLYDEGFLVENWYDYEQQIPAWLSAMDDDAERYFTTSDGKLIALAPQPDPNIWGFQIRKDWLDALGLDVPGTPEELFEIARAFTFDDPDNNGKDDTWGLTSAGAGQNVGEIANLKLMWGPNNFYVKDNEVSHFVIDGTEKAFLDYMRRVVDAGIIEPNWYTIAWSERKAPLFQGALGTAWYPGVLVTEFVNEGGWEPEDAVKLWTHMPMPAGSPEGGKLYPPGFFSRMHTVSANAESDTVKFMKIIELMEGVCFPNPGYYKLRFGVEIDKGKLVDLPGGYKVTLAGPGSERYRSGENFLGAADWGKWHSSRGDLVIFSSGTSEDDIPMDVYGQIDLNSGAQAEDTYAPDAHYLHLDKTIEGELNTILNEFEYKYITGATDDYDAFVQRWLDAGGQQLLVDAEEQFRQIGLIK